MLSRHPTARSGKRDLPANARNAKMKSREVLVTSSSNSRRSPPDSSIDAAPTRMRASTSNTIAPLVKPGKRLACAAWTSPSGKTDSINSDLKAFGFAAAQIKDMVGRNPVFDPQTLLPAGVTRDMWEKENKGAGLKRAQRERRRRKMAKADYTPLVLGKDARWVLFDPIRDLSASLPAVIEKFAAFAPGNLKILEYNQGSGSVRLRSTPAVLRSGKRVEYAATGPKVVELDSKQISVDQRKPTNPLIRKATNAAPVAATSKIKTEQLSSDDTDESDLTDIEDLELNAREIADSQESA